MAESLVVAAVPWGAAARLLVTGAATMGSPGPATVSLAAAGSAYGVRRSASFFAGILGGTMLVLATVASAQLAHDATVDAAAKTAILAPLLVDSMSIWLTVGASLAPVLRDRRRARIVNVVLAATLVAATALAVVH